MSEHLVLIIIPDPNDFNETFIIIFGRKFTFAFLLTGGSWNLLKIAGGSTANMEMVCFRRHFFSNNFFFASNIFVMIIFTRLSI